MTVSVPRIEKLLAEATERPWAASDHGGRIEVCSGNLFVAEIDVSYDTEFDRGQCEADAALICEAVNALPVLIAVVKACEHAGVCKLCDRLVRIHGHRTGCPIAPFSFEEQT